MDMRNPMPLRGGNWNNGSNAGLGALNFNNARSNSNSNIGFRPALDDARSNHFTECCPCISEKDATASAIAETSIRPVDASAGCLFSKLYQFDHLLSAAYACRKGKAYKTPTLQYFNNLEENLIELQNNLIWGSYEPAPHHKFFVFEPKKRLINAPAFKDRVLHSALYKLLYPLFDRTFIFDSYACRVGKGTHAGADRAQKFIRQVESGHGKAYVLKADISRYFASIDQDILKGLLVKKVRCQGVLNLLLKIIDTSPADAPGKGIPLGNLTSQLFANIYLHELDRFAKHTLKAKRYVRYMDDFIFVHHDKKQLHQWRKQVNEFLWRELKLTTNHKTQVFPVGIRFGRSLDFLGYRMWSTHRLIRKNSVKRIKANLKKYSKLRAAGVLTLRDIEHKIQSWLGHASHANTHNLKQSLFSKWLELRSKTHV